MSLPERRTSRLHWGRVSTPGARYFLTLCAQARAPAFASSETASALLAAISALHSSKDADLIAATIMPDHAHLFITLGDRLRLGQVVGKFKTLARDHGRAAWRWQEDGFEHRLRAEESVEDYAFYIFMNPYRARLLPTTQPWPRWVCPDPIRLRFTQHLGPDGTPPPEWLGQIDSIASRLTTGEP